MVYDRFLTLNFGIRDNEICSELFTEYGVTSVCNVTVADLEENVGYKYPNKDEMTKSAQERFRVTVNAILAEADNFTVAARQGEIWVIQKETRKPQDCMTKDRR